MFALLFQRHVTWACSAARHSKVDILVHGTLVHTATFFRAVLARASYHLTSTFLTSPGPSAAPAELKPDAPAADVAVSVV